jgi:hypothetical protein
MFISLACLSTMSSGQETGGIFEHPRKEGEEVLGGFPLYLYSLFYPLHTTGDRPRDIND